jgi:glycosyltransferase involved in cell wall biosynthesis
MRRRIAFIVQRCGIEVNGGAELHCRLVAERLGGAHDVEVLTTCALDYMTWANHYPPGEQKIGDLRVRRFPVERVRDVEAFNRLSAAIHPRIATASLDEQERWMREQGPWTPSLFEYVRTSKNDYDAFIFFTYLYATTYFGLPLVAEKALLVPTAHDEWPIHLSMWNRVFELPRAFAFNSDEELAFLRRRFRNAPLRGTVVGVAVDAPEHTDPAAFRKRHRIDGPYVLYVGRIDASKGVDRLLEDFAAYQRSTGDERTELILVGNAVMELPNRPRVRALGFLRDQDKWDAIGGCDVLVMPSPFESLSMACLEAWSLGKPVLVTAKSEVLVGQCRRSQGGLWYRDTDEFAAALDYLRRDSATACALGRQGREFVQANYRWERILDAYEKLVNVAAGQAR